MEEEWIDIQTNISKEQWLAYQIWLVLFDYYSDNFDNDATEITEDFINSLNFHILSKEDMSHKNHIISFSLARQLDFDLLDKHLQHNVINKRFENKTINSVSKKYATIWI